MRIRFFLGLIFFPSLLFAASAKPVIVPLSTIHQSVEILGQPVHEHKERFFTQVEREKMFATSTHTVVSGAKFQ